MVCDPIGNNKSGVVVSTLRFGKLLKERGHNIIFVGARSKEYQDHGFIDGIKVYRYRSLPIPKSGGWHAAFPTVKELKRTFEKEKIDIVHITLPMSGAIVAVKAARELGLKVVAHSHSQPENLFMDMPTLIQPMLGNLWNRYLAWIYRKAEFLIYPSEMARNLLDKLSDARQPSEVISNGVDVRHFKQVNIGDFYERFGVPEHTIKLLFVGRLYPEKSIDTLIRAVPYITREYPRIHIMIVGGGHMRSKLERLANSLGVEAYITFLGLVSDEDKIIAYSASDVFVFPSIAELEGMAVLEAMACGKPVIISDARMSASRYFVDGNGLLFRALDAEDLARQAIKLIADPDLRRKMGETSLEKVKNYDIHRSTELLEEVYYSVLQK